VPFSVDVTIPAKNNTIFDVLLVNDFAENDSGSVNWDNVTRFLYQKKSGDKIEGSSCIQYVIEGPTDSPTYKLVNDSANEANCRITLTKDLKVEITELGPIGAETNPITDWDTLSQILMPNPMDQEETLYIAGEFNASSTIGMLYPAIIIPKGDVKFVRGTDFVGTDFSDAMFFCEYNKNLTLGSEDGIITFDNAENSNFFIESSAEKLTLTNCVFQNSSGNADINIMAGETAVSLNGKVIGNIQFENSITPISVGSLSEDSSIGIYLSDPENMSNETILQPVEGVSVDLNNFKILNAGYTIEKDSTGSFVVVKQN
jgi:hypothetical protein